jgi:hypothetical protein
MTFGQTIDKMAAQSKHTWENPSWWSLFVVLPWTLGAILSIYQWNVDRGIVRREQTAPGVITAHEPENHNRFGYVFNVNGKSFAGWESPTKDELRIGLSVLVYYDPLDPSKNALTRFEDRALNSMGPVPMMLFGIGAVVWYVLSQRRKNRLQTNT